jgi:hypothetical protein
MDRTRDRKSRLTIALCSVTLLVLSGPSHAGPWIDPGDSGLRHDIQVLADAGIIEGPVSTWPLSWGDIGGALSAAPDPGLGAAELAAIRRLRSRFERAGVVGTLRFNAHASATSHPREIRTFEDGPREGGEVGAGVEWTGERFAARLSGQWVDDPDDNKDWRADGSYLGAALGNWMLAASTSDRYWGPGWQSSMILSNNARPIPAFTLERNETSPFKTRWLSWMGPWDLAVLWGFLDDDRAIPNARVFSARLNFRPLHSLEVGLTGMGLWCGSGNDCGLDELGDMVTGAGTSDEYDRLAGIDLRWSGSLAGVPVAAYTHWVGEDFGDGASRLLIPSKLLALFGAELTGFHDGLGSYRIFVEWADTECDFSLYRQLSGDGGGGKPGCAYRNSKYQSGQTYRGRSVAHSLDQDSSVATVGGVLNDHSNNEWLATVAGGKLNRRGANRSTVAPNETDYVEAEVSHRRSFWLGSLKLGLGYEYRKDQTTDQDEDDFRAFIEWRLGD